MPAINKALAAGTVPVDALSSDGLTIALPRPSRSRQQRGGPGERRHPNEGDFRQHRQHPLAGTFRFDATAARYAQRRHRRAGGRGAARTERALCLGRRKGRQGQDARHQGRPGGRENVGRHAGSLARRKRGDRRAIPLEGRRARAADAGADADPLADRGAARRDIAGRGGCGARRPPATPTPTPSRGAAAAGRAPRPPPRRPDHGAQHLRTVHSVSDRDVAADGRPPVHRHRRLSEFAGRAAAASRFSDAASLRATPRRQSGDDGLRGGATARDAIRADFRRLADDLGLHARFDRDHAAVRPQPQYRRRGERRAGGDQRRRRAIAEESADARRPSRKSTRRTRRFSCFPRVPNRCR